MRKTVAIHPDFREDYKKRIMHTHQKIEFIESEIYKIPLYGKKVGLENMRRLLHEIDREIPIMEYLEKTPIIHVTGTNGKGSVCNMLSRIYSRAGYTVGLFTSPHMDHITERVQINNKNVDEARFANAFQCVERICHRLKEEDVIPTFFEWMFSIALICFHSTQSNFLILEVGIGGRLDTTNIIPGKVLSIICPIGLDHQHLLGNTIGEIAAEKAGIIAKDSKVVYYNNTDEVNVVIEKVISEKNAISYPVLPFEKKIHTSSHLGIDFSLVNKYYKYNSVFLPTVCDYQIDNAGIALTAVHALQDQFPVDDTLIMEGLRAFYWPGRFESLHEKLIIDGAHNEMGALKLIETLEHLYDGVPLNLLLAVKEGKNYEEILDVFIGSNIFNIVFLYEMHSTASVPISILKKSLDTKGCKSEVVQDLTSFLHDYLKESQTLLIGAGSLYLMSEIRKSYFEGGLHD